MAAVTEIAVSPSSLDEIVRRCGALYSLPAVAVEVLALTSQSKVDVRALKTCIERDPALTAKILRVVNSSLFGLPREVGELNQALALLGAKPLKLLVLGFSLPENLFLEAARDQLDWYWNTTMVRAVAAREVSEQLFGLPGDDAFVAGLLEDLGVLALLGQLGRPYAALVGEAIRTRADLNQLERDALGFDHTQLTAGLLEHWNMPSAIVRAVAEPRDWRRWAGSRASHAPLVRVLHLAEFFAQLVGQHRLSVLPDLLETGVAYCELDKERLHNLVAALEPKVRQLAGVLSLDFDGGDYTQILLQAHAQMASIAESVVPALSAVGEALFHTERSDEQERSALRIAHELRESVERFLHGRAGGDRAEAEAADRPAIAAGSLDRGDSLETLLAPAAEQTLRFSGPARDKFDVRLTLDVGQCRSSRQPLSILLLGVSTASQLDAEQAPLLEKLLDGACYDVGATRDRIERLDDGRRLLVLPGRDRGETVAAARAAVDKLRKWLAPLDRGGRLPACTAAAGVASVSSPAKNFQAERLVETARRCLAAAIASGGVKSLEVI